MKLTIDGETPRMSERPSSLSSQYSLNNHSLCV